MRDLEDEYSISKEWCDDPYPMFLVRTKANNRVIGKDRFYDNAVKLAKDHNRKAMVERSPYASVVMSLFKMADECDTPVHELLKAAEPVLDAVRPKPVESGNTVFINTGLLF